MDQSQTLGSRRNFIEEKLKKFLLKMMLMLLEEFFTSMRLSKQSEVLTGLLSDVAALGHVEVVRLL